MEVGVEEVEEAMEDKEESLVVEEDVEVAAVITLQVMVRQPEKDIKDRRHVQAE